MGGIQSRLCSCDHAQECKNAVRDLKGIIYSQRKTLARHVKKSSKLSDAEHIAALDGKLAPDHKISLSMAVNNHGKAEKVLIPFFLTRVNSKHFYTEFFPQMSNSCVSKSIPKNRRLGNITHTFKCPVVVSLTISCHESCDEKQCSVFFCIHETCSVFFCIHDSKICFYLLSILFHSIITALFKKALSDTYYKTLLNTFYIFDSVLVA